jgi:type IV pilus assembly protein PilA
MNKTTIPGLLVIFALLSTSSSTAAKDADPSIDKRQIEQRTVSLFYENGADKPYTGLITETYRDGAPQRTKTVVDGNLTGAIEWYRNGQKAKEATIDNSSISGGSGHATEWYENGQMKSDQDILGGRPAGLVTKWYENGQMESQGTHIYIETAIPASRPDGLVTKWDESGQMRSQETYVNGRVQQETTWDENGDNSTTRPAIKEALTLTGGAKAAVTEYWYDTGRFAVDNQTAGLSPGPQIRGTYVASVIVETGVIAVAFGADAGEEYSGQTLILTPMPSPDGGSMEWQCSSPDIAPEVLPKECK